MVVQSTVKLTDDQKAALALVKQSKRHTLFYGGSRSGKTFLIVLVIVIRALMFPKSRHLIYRLRLKDAIQSIWLETLPKVISLYTGLGGMVKANETRHVMEFPNGSEIWVAGVDDARSEDSVLGKEYVTIYHNEASQIPYLTAWKVRTRLAQRIDGCAAREFVDLNPTTRAHWTHREFVEHIDPIHYKPGDKKSVDDPDQYVFYQLNPGGNTDNIDPEYIRLLSNAPDSMRRRFYLGEYSDDDGILVFPVQADGVYVAADFDAWARAVGPANVRLVAGLDIGFEDADAFVVIAYAAHPEIDRSNPKSIIEAIQRGTPTPNVPPELLRKSWLLYEYKARRTGIADLAKEIKTGLEWSRSLAARLGMSNSNVLIYSDTGGGGKKIVYDLRNIYGLPVTAAYKLDKEAAIELLQDEIKNSDFMIPIDGEFAQEAELIVWTKDPETGEIIRVIDNKQFHPDEMDAILYAKRPQWMRGRQA